jgi:hypothetical protein
MAQNLAVPKKSQHSAVRTAWRKFLKSRVESEDNTPRLSMKAFARGEWHNDELLEKCQDWLFNKSANFSKPQLGIGSTRRTKGGQKN